MCLILVTIFIGSDKPIIEWEIPTCLELDGYKWSLTGRSMAGESLGLV